jgi:hypothetical protein
MMRSPYTAFKIRVFDPQPNLCTHPGGLSSRQAPRGYWMYTFGEFLPFQRAYKRGAAVTGAGDGHATYKIGRRATTDRERSLVLKVGFGDRDRIQKCNLGNEQRWRAGRLGKVLEKNRENMIAIVRVWAFAICWGDMSDAMSTLGSRARSARLPGAQMR